MPYNPRPLTSLPELSNNPELRAIAEYVQTELQTLARSLVETTALDLRTVKVAPSKPREGMIVCADGTTWNPGSGGGAYVYFGSTWVYLGPTAGAGLTVTKVTVSFTTPASAAFFDVALVGATVGQKVLATVSLDMPAGVDEDELEMDPISVAGYVTTINQVRLFVSSDNGDTIYGDRNINVTLV